MSLIFSGGDTDNVNCGSDASLDDLTAFTWWAWIFLDADVADTMHRGIFSKLTSNVISGKALWINSVSGSNNLRAHIQRATTPASAQGGDVPVGSWAFVALTYDESDGARLWLGSLTSAPAEVASAVGSGATSADATANLYLGNRAPNNTPNSESLPGKIARAAALAQRLTAVGLRTVWYDSLHSMFFDARGFWVLGFNGTGTQPDWSGNFNAGTVTGATAGPHVPLVLASPHIYSPYVVSASDFPLDAQPGSFTLTGQTLGSDVGLQASPGSYSVTGITATFDVGLLANAGSFALTGLAANFDIAINAAAGSYTWTGIVADLVYAAGGDFPLDAQPGSFALSGLATGFDIGVNAQPGSYSETGSAAGFDVGLNAAPGSVSWSGIAADLGAVGSYAIVASIGARNVVIASMAARGSSTFSAVGVRANVIVSEVSGGGS